MQDGCGDRRAKSLFVIAEACRERCLLMRQMPPSEKGLRSVCKPLLGTLTHMTEGSHRRTCLRLASPCSRENTGKISALEAGDGDAAPSIRQQFKAFAPNSLTIEPRNSRCRASSLRNPGPPYHGLYRLRLKSGRMSIPLRDLIADQGKQNCLLGGRPRGPRRCIIGKTRPHLLTAFLPSFVLRRVG